MAVLIYNTIKKAAGGSAQDDFDIDIALSWDTDLGSVAFDTATERMFEGVYQTATDSDGYWSVQVVENDIVTPVDSVYKITETERGNATVLHEYYISVPTDATPTDLWVGELIVPTPAWEA